MAVQDDQVSRASQDDNYHTAFDDDDLEDTVQFGNPVTQPFLSRSVRVPTTEEGCLSFTQMFQDYLQEYLSPSQADTFLQIEEMAQRLDVYLNQYPAQYINCMTSDSEFVAFVNYAIQLAFDLMADPTIWAVLSILLETQDVNTSYVQVMHDYCNECYNMKIKDYMTRLEQAGERSKNNMYNSTLDGVSAYIQQPVYDAQMQSTDQHDVNAGNEAQYRENRQDILNARQTDTPVKTQDNRQVLDDIEAYAQDRLNIMQSLNHRLGPRKSSLLGAQPVIFAMVQSNLLTTNIPTHLSNKIDTGQQDDSDYQDDRDEELYQVDGTTNVQSPTDNSDNNEEDEPDSNACKRQRKTYVPANTERKEMTKKRQADVLKKQQEKDKAKAQAAANKDKPDNTNRPRTHRFQGKASHPDQIKNSNKGRKTAR